MLILKLPGNLADIQPSLAVNPNITQVAQFDNPAT